MASSKPLTSPVDPPFSPYQDSPTSLNHSLHDDIEHVAIEDNVPKPEDHFLGKDEKATPTRKATQPYDPYTAPESPTTPGFDASHPYDPYTAKLSPSKSRVTFESHDEEKVAKFECSSAGWALQVDQD